jgi:drug/metabolite transporter (DMT)-like permease
MTLHQASGRWRLGFGLTMATALFWATLPIALKVALEILDPITLTWFRFVVAMLFTLA